MAKNLKTFIISKFQIQALRNLLIANGETAEAEKLSGSDLALRWKAINLENIGSKTQKENFTKQYPYFVDYPLQDQIAPAKETKTEETTSTETTAEMTSAETTPAPTKKNKKQNA